MIGRLITVQEAVSTQDLARDMASRGEPEGTAVMALKQTRGRGRAGHAWVSPPGKNLALSVILRPRLRPAQAPLLGLIAGIAVAEIAEFMGVPRVLLKWPNDVLVDEKKIAGILSEASIRGDEVEFAIIGIGFNVNADLSDFPDDLAASVTSIKLSTGKEWELSDAANQILDRLGPLYDRMITEGCGFVRPLWESRWGHKGQVVNWEGIIGVARGILDDGSLVLRASDGRVHNICAGDVVPAAI